MINFNISILRKMDLTTKLSIINFIFILALAINISVFSIYLAQTFFLEKSIIGLITIYDLTLAIIFSVFISSIVQKYHEKKLLVISIIFIIISYILLSFTDKFLFAFLIISSLIFFKSLRTITFNILYKDQASEIPLDKKESFLFTFINLGWFLGPFVAALFLTYFKVNFIFLIAALFMFIGLALFLSLNVHDIKNYEVKKTSFKKKIYAYKDYLKNSANRQHFLSSAGIHILWAFIFTFMPLLIIENGFSASIASFFIALTFLPIIFSEAFSFHIYRKIGVKNMFYIGYMLPILGALGAFFVLDYNLKMLFLILGSVGYAFIEPVREIYFFERFKGSQEEKYYPLFNNCNSFGLLAGIIIFTIFFYLNINHNYVFLILALSLSLFLFNVKKIKEKK